MAARRPGAGRGLAGEEERDRGDDQHHADDGEGVAERHDQRLPMHDLADRHDRLTLRGARSTIPCASK